MSAAARDLSAGFQILWYRIESVLGRGGFGVTYLATDINLGQSVAIKEYLPHEFATRGEDSTVQPISEDQENTYNWGLERFMSEAQILAKFRHPNIVRVLSVFKHNNTGYMVMEYEHGEPLNKVYASKKHLTQAELQAIYYPIIEGLMQVHEQGFIHRDIKPANIFIREDGSPVLLDFGAARHAIGSQTRTLTAMLTVGYAPFEQYNEGNERQGPWTDIYSMSACLHEGVSGSKPIDSMKRGMMLLHNESDPYVPLSWDEREGFEKSFLRGIDQGLMVQVHDRPQTLQAFMDILQGKTQLEDIPQKTVEDSLLMATTVVRPVPKSVETRKKQADATIAKTRNIKVDPATEVIDPQVDFNTAEEAQAPPGSEHKEEKTSPGSKPKKVVLIAGGLITIVVLMLLIPWPESSRDEPDLSLTPTPEETPVTSVEPTPAAVETPVPSAESTPAPVESSSTPVQKPVDARQEKIDALLREADQFYKDRIFINSGEDHALNRYQQVLSLDSQHELAAGRVQEIGDMLLSKADEAISAGNIVGAGVLLKAVNGIDPDFKGLPEARNKLTQAKQETRQQGRLEELLNLANKAMQSGLFYSPENQNAATYFQQALEIDPGNTRAQEGLKSISEQLVGEIQKNLDSGQPNRAETLLSRLQSISPDHPSIKELKGEIAASKQILSLTRDAEAAFKAQRYTIPESGSALSLYRRILTLSPGHKLASSRLDDIAAIYSTTARNAIRNGNIKSARHNLDILRNQFPQHSDIPALTADLKALQAKLDISKLLPEGINQNQGDDAVVESIVDKFVRSFKNQNLEQMKQVAQFDQRQEAFFESLFNQYISMNLALVPASYTINKKEGQASVDFEITELVDKNGNSVITSADWTKIGLVIRKENDAWLKADIN